MRKTLLTFSLFVLAHSLFCQEDSLLKNFKFRINHYQAITINIGAGSQFNNFNSGADKSKSSSASGNLGGDYYFLKSTDRILFTAYAGMSAAYNFDKHDDVSTHYKNHNLALFPYFNLLNKWFGKKYFTELGADFNSNFQNSKSSGTYKQREYDFSLTAHAGIGKGRLENITDMQNALWLYKSLTDEHQLSQSLTADDLNELGHSITTANNTRILDPRKRTRFILESVDNYFQRKKLIPVTDVRYFSNLNDLLFFAFNNSRLSGTEKYIRLTPTITYNSLNQMDNILFTQYKDMATSKSIALSVGFSKYHPVNLKHQNNLGASLFADYTSQDDRNKSFASGAPVNELEYNSILRQAGINLFFQHAIYPNTRTVISFDLESQSGYQEPEVGSSFFTNTSLSGTLNYFISYRTRLTASLGSFYDKNYYDDLRLYFNAGIGVSL